MKQIKVISVCKTDCSSTTYKNVLGKNGQLKKVVCYNKITKSGWGMYIEIDTLPNGKKSSVTKHGQIPS